MEPPLWIDEHAPALADLPQADARDYLTEGVDEPINLVLHGPPGSGKTAAVRALAFEGLAASRPSLLEVYDDVRTEFEADPLRDALEDE